MRRYNQFSRTLLQIVGYARNDDTKKYILDGDITFEKIKVEYHCTLFFG